MSLKKITITGMFILFIFSGWNAMAQENLSCSDIDWKPAVTDKYPNISDACVGVLNRNGKIMAKVRMKVFAVKNDKVSFRFIEPNNTLSKFYQADLDAEWSSAINEKRLNQRDYADGITLSAYIPYDRWAMMRGDEGASPNPAFAVEIYDIEDTQKLADAVEEYADDMREELSDMVENQEAVTEGETEQMAKVENSPAMPVTAGMLPLIGLLGAGFMALGGGIRFLRRRFK